MSPAPVRGSVWNRLKAWFGSTSADRAPRPSRSAEFQLLYARFREILALNDSVLQLIADIDDVAGGDTPASLELLAPRIRRAAMDVFVMAKNLNLITKSHHRALYDALSAIDAKIEAALPAQALPIEGPLVLPLGAIRLVDAPRVGMKMATLGECLATGRWFVPGGFAITTAAFAKLMADLELWERAERLESILASEGPAALAEACREVRDVILRTPVPDPIATAIRESYDDLAFGQRVEVAMRSSAVGEDSALSHAGQYHTELGVDRDRLLDAYRQVVASAYEPGAVSYRAAHGLSGRDALMAVGCMRMVAPRVSGVVYSRAFEAADRDVVVVSATVGLAAELVGGTKPAEEVRIVGGRSVAPSDLLSEPECKALAGLARDLESFRGLPQDVEWAIDGAGDLQLLQTRPLALPSADAAGAEGLSVEGQEPVASGGQMACPGAAAGEVFVVRDEDALDACPEGAVLVARHSSPKFALVMGRCAAIVTEVGSPTGHMAIIAREYEVPAIVGLARALALLSAEPVVTVDATGLRVYAGRLPLPERPRLSRARPAAPVRKPFERLVDLVTPLRLLDPSSADFKAESCQSLHDITRFVHEKVFEVMFFSGDLAARGGHETIVLEAHLPIDVLVYDVGGGLSEQSKGAPRVRTEDIVSLPGRAFLSGLSDPRIRWDLPRPLSGRGFLSVLGDGIAGPPPEAREVGRHSFAVFSDRYMNFSTKAGYHFSTVDTYCGASLGKNYIHFRFEKGGAAGPRRARRVRFLSKVLAALDFSTQVRSDVLVGRMEKYDRETIQARLADLGRLTLCARQLDMLMDTDASPDFFADRFLAGDFASF